CPAICLCLAAIYFYAQNCRADQQQRNLCRYYAGCHVHCRRFVKRRLHELLGGITVTSTSKRSQLINLARMRKYFAPRPIALSVAAIMLTACGDQQEATIYTNEADCAD